MKSLKKTLVSLVGVSALSLSLALPAMATYDVPTVNDCTSSLVNVTATVKQLIAVLVPIKIENVKVVNINDSFNGTDINIIKNSFNGLSALDKLTLQNNTVAVPVLDGLKLTNVGNVLIKDGIDASKVVGVFVDPVLNKILVFVDVL